MSFEPENPAPFDLICYDFDGVMTDNRVYISEAGVESVIVNRSDGLAIAALNRLNVRQTIISTEENPVVGVRAKKLKIPVLQGVSDKAERLKRLAIEEGIDLARAAYIGNDLNDLEAMRLVGSPVAPSDAHPSILEIAVYVALVPGGAGVIRDFCDRFYPGVI